MSASNFKLLIRKTVRFQCSDYLNALTQHARKSNGFINSINFTESYLPLKGDSNSDRITDLDSDLVTVNTISEWKNRSSAFKWIHSNERANIKHDFKDVILDETYGVLHEMNLATYNTPLL
jgi:hypothetical protein